MIPAPNELDSKLLDLKDLVSGGKYIPSFIKAPLEHFLGLSRLNKAYTRIKRAMDLGSRDNFFALATRHLNLDYVLRPGELENIPATGPVVVVSNHPYGMADGMMFGDMLLKRRSDVKILVNQQLTVFERMRPWLIEVDVYGSAESKSKNRQGMRELLGWLKKGGCIGIFPAGSASSYSWKDKHVVDDPWSAHIASIIRHTQSTVVPVHFPGRNSLLFQVVSFLSRAARVALLPREVGYSGKRCQKILIGKPLTPSQLKNFESDEALMSHLRLRSYLLGKNYDNKRGSIQEKRSPESTEQAPIIEEIPATILTKEIESLPREQILVEKNNWIVYYAKAAQIPQTLREIGRLREISFRLIGEGSGTSCDLDKYDNYYSHLFLWDKDEKRLAGAYRMGLSDEIMASHGYKGFYNSQFFTFDQESLAKMTPGIEMGRAFIPPAYQKRPLTLGLIWEGIGQFMVKFPQYRYLFGTVSTSADYSSLSHSLIITFLKAHAMDQELASLIQSQTPPGKSTLRLPETRILPDALSDPQDLSNLISEIENDGKGIPVLLRQYLKLNGKILSFNIDKSFGNVLDCLILVDMYKTPERSLKRYLGEAACKKILEIRQKELLEEENKES